jgi:hypothetical protein
VTSESSLSSSQLDRFEQSVTQLLLGGIHPRLNHDKNPSHLLILELLPVTIRIMESVRRVRFEPAKAFALCL